MLLNYLSRWFYLIDRISALTYKPFTSSYTNKTWDIRNVLKHSSLVHANHLIKQDYFTWDQWPLTSSLRLQDHLPPSSFTTYQFPYQRENLWSKVDNIEFNHFPWAQKTLLFSLITVASFSISAGGFRKNYQTILIQKILCDAAIHDVDF